MPNVVKYASGATAANCLLANYLQIGNNNGDYGTSFYTGITPGANGYTLYFDKASNGPSIYTPANDEQLIKITNQMAGATFTTADQCFGYFLNPANTTGTLVNRDYSVSFPYVNINGLAMHLQSTLTESYSGSGATWNDVGGRGPRNNGTLNGGIVYDAPSKTFTFGGTGTVTVPNNTFINPSQSGDAITINVWVYYTTLSSIAGLAVKCDDPQTLGYKMELTTSPGVKFTVFLQGAGKTDTVDAAVSMGGNEFVNLTATHDGTDIKVYHNGYVVGSTTATGYIADSSGHSLTIGQELVGGLGMVQIYNRALSDTEILENYLNTANIFATPSINV